MSSYNFCIFQTRLALNVPSNLVPFAFLKHFRGERGCPSYGPSAHPGRHFATRTLQYKRVFGAVLWTYFGAFLGQEVPHQGGTWYSTSAKPESMGKQINAIFLYKVFRERFHAVNRGRPRPKFAFFCDPGDGEKLLDPRASRHKGQECPWEIRTE